MKTSFTKIKIGAALLLGSALLARTGFWAEGAEVGAQVKQVFAEKLANVPGKSLTVIMVTYARSGELLVRVYAAGVTSKEPPLASTFRHKSESAQRGTY